MGTKLLASPNDGHDDNEVVVNPSSKASSYSVTSSLKKIVVAMVVCGGLVVYGGTKPGISGSTPGIKPHSLIGSITGPTPGIKPHNLIGSITGSTPKIKPHNLIGSITGPTPGIEPHNLIGSITGSTPKIKPHNLIGSITGP